MNFAGKRILFVDWESFFDTKAGYGLKELSVTEYVRDARFKPHGIGYQYLDGERAHWVSGGHAIEAFIGSIDWSETVVIAHNIKFDGAILAWRYGVKPYAWFDTVALAKAVLGEQVSGYSLKSLAEYLGFDPKGELTCDGILTPSAEQLAALGEYCKHDVELCKGIYEKLIGQFPVGQLWHVDWTIRAFVEPRLRLDKATLEKGVEAEKARREAAIKASGVEKAVLSSNKQFAEYLQRLGVQVPTKRSGRTGKDIPAFARTDEGLATLERTHPCLYAGRIASKANLLETRGESLLAVAKTGLFPFDVGFSGAVQTHRYSGGSGAGGNPQNFTRNSFLRAAVASPSGYKLIVGDFAAIELRILAWLANEPKLINAIVNDGDPYLDFASQFFARKLTKKEHPAERHFGKGAILGLGYGMGGDKFLATVKALKPDSRWTAQQVGALSHLQATFTEEMSYATIRLYRETYFNVPKLWNFAQMAIPLIAEGRIASLHFAPFLKVRKNAIILPSGLAIQYPNLRSATTYQRGKPRVEWMYDVYKKKYESEPARLYGGKLVENICQALAGEICKEAIKRAEDWGFDCVGQVHDEIIGVMDTEPMQFADSVKSFEAAMSRSPSWWPAIRLKAEVGTGEDWANAKS